MLPLFFTHLLFNKTFRIQSQAWSSDKRLVKSFRRTNTYAGANNKILTFNDSIKTGVQNILSAIILFHFCPLL